MAVYKTSEPFQKEKAEKYFARLIEKQETIELKKHAPQRTNPQNAYLHACLKLFALEYGEKQGSVFNMEEIKTLAKRKCPMMFYEKAGEKYLRSSADLDTKEMTDFIDAFRNWSSKEAGIYIPDADEFKENEGQIQEYIRINSQYL